MVTNESFNGTTQLRSMGPSVRHHPPPHAPYQPAVRGFQTTSGVMGHTVRGSRAGGTPLSTQRVLVPSTLLVHGPHLTKPEDCPISGQHCGDRLGLAFAFVACLSLGRGFAQYRPLLVTPPHLHRSATWRGVHSWGRGLECISTTTFSTVRGVGGRGGGISCVPCNEGTALRRVLHCCSRAAALAQTDATGSSLGAGPRLRQPESSPTPHRLLMRWQHAQFPRCGWV